jgi:hypothetical protein
MKRYLYLYRLITKIKSLTKIAELRQNKLGMHRIYGRPDIRPDNPAFFDIRYPAGYQIALPDIR